jgi:hypothetical protein
MLEEMVRVTLNEPASVAPNLIAYGEMSSMTL